MKGQEIIKDIVRAEMPDREALRRDCLRAAEAKAASKRGIWIRRVIPATACLAVIIAAVLIVSRLSGAPGDTLSVGPEKPVPSQAAKGDNVSVEDKAPEPDYGVYVPAFELPKNTDGLALDALDMIGLFLYQGKIYTQAEFYYKEDVAAVKGLVGEWVGRAKGNIDEWSKQDEYAKELAGSVAGDIYTVKGYDPQFRLCIMESYIDEDGNYIEWLNFYENLNGIGLTYGADLFGERLGLRENWSGVKSQSHDNWDYYEQIYSDLTGLSDDDIEAFIDALYAGAFELVADNFYNPEQKQAHLYFEMTDNTVVELRLFEGGYVGYRHMGWYFVKMPGEAFDAVFKACR